MPRMNGKEEYDGTFPLLSALGRLTRPGLSYKCLPDRFQSYMAVMLNMTDSTDGFSFTQRSLFPF